ncbi:hypothetical protein FNV43_RR24436 [Rhamnella rubrinervis]|uniref:Cation/H+ exchanger domain-containing protein n=1 Tax=Rhamnella rubrinervis TaxID=2594499 RepID=A0A8K0DS93_9ROSA|nr:hypothetical protein FNV43_RR24436 [Rhamnella rubrinervis]
MLQKVEIVTTFGNITSNDYFYGSYNTSWYKGHRVICSPEKRVRSGGIFNGDNPFDYVFPVFIAQVILVTSFSRIFYFLLRPFKQPKFVSNILGGIVLGPSVLGRSQRFREIIFPLRESEFLSTAAAIGAIYSVFIIAVKMDIDMILRAARNAWRIGIISFVVPLLVSYSCLYPISDKFQGIMKGTFLFYVALSLSFTYFPVLAESLRELNLVNSELGQLAMSSAMLNDLIQWFFVALSVFIKQENTRDAVQALLGFLGLLGICIKVIRPAVVRIVKSTPEGKPVREIYVTALLIGTLVIAFFSDALGGTTISGPLFLGLVIPDGPPLGAALVEKSDYLVSEFFMPLFFAHVGFNTDIAAIEDWASFHRFQFTINMGFLAKLVGTMVAALCCKIKFRNAFLMGLIMNIKGILEVISFHKWKTHKLIDEQTYTQLVISMMVITMLVTPLIKILTKPQTRLNPSLMNRGLRTLQSMPKSSEFRVLFCVHHEESVNSIIKLLEVSSASHASPTCAYVIHAVELVGRAAPLLLPYHQNRRTFRPAFSSKTDTICRAFENYCRVSKGTVSVQPFTMISPYETMHETISSFSQDKLIPLLIVPFHQNQQYLVSRSTANSIRQFNVNLQTSAPCTVGVLVDRSFSIPVLSANFSCRIAVIFIGGPDDREAIAMAARMSEHKDVIVTVVRIVNLWCTSNGYKEDPELEWEKGLDDAALDEFKFKSMKNEFVTWCEVEAEDDVEVVNGVRALQGNYDLVIVGRRRWSSAETIGDKEMTDFVENPELGVLGDILASSDFCGGMVSVLVMQHSGGVGANHSLRHNSSNLYYTRLGDDMNFG